MATKRRQWDDEKKREIVAEIATLGSVKAVMEKHNVASSVITRWRKKYSGKAAARAKPKPNGKFIDVSLRLPKELNATLDEIATKSGEKKTSVVHVILTMQVMRLQANQAQAELDKVREIVSAGRKAQ